MQGISRLIIATAAIVGILVVVLVYAANENDRMEAFDAGFRGRAIEDGAALYSEACATCHGANGEGLVGPALNAADLLVPEPGESLPPRVIARGWKGDLHSFLATSISSGRVGTVMPAWGQKAGGPYSEQQIDNIATFIMNWASEPGKKWGGATERVAIGGVEPISAPVAEAMPSPPPSDVRSAELGRYLFQGPAGCAECHAFDGATGVIGPDLTGVVENKGRDYVYNSIVDPTAAGHDKTVMPESLSFSLSEIEIQSIIDYLENPEAAKPAEEAAPEKPSGPEAGQQIAQAQGCLGCHTVDGSSLVGPTWLGLFGSTRKLTDGSQAIADRDYLYRAIVDPNVEVVDGFNPGIMPQDYGDRLSEDEIQAIIDYIETLK
ncbi:MAG: c-type cytochrome [Chloroflexi bacterium]|nr:c-type cytochrome [Chloroflexota bacterium]